MNPLSVSFFVGALLSTLVTDRAPWTHIEANSEQRQPLYLGASPREMILFGQKASRPSISIELKKWAEVQAEAIRKILGMDHLQFEVWPVHSIENGRRTWAFARWRSGPDDDWHWLNSKKFKFLEKELELMPELPLTLKSWIPAHRKLLFEDFLNLDQLYDKPQFGNCVWIDQKTNQLVGAWLPPSRLREFKAKFSKKGGPKRICQVIPQPARFNETPISFVLDVTPNQLIWPTSIQWQSESQKLIEMPALAPHIMSWPASFESSYREDVVLLSGEEETEFPISKRRIRWKKKNCAQKDHELEEFVDYLEERYQLLGFQVGNTKFDQLAYPVQSKTLFRQRFQWHGIPQSNLIAIIPGSLPASQNRPILFADHIDTAFSEDIFNQSKTRISAPGADDNVTAVAALLRGAELFKDMKPLHDIWLVHLTGEEYPADDLGVRHLIGFLLQSKKTIGGVVLLDMIGYAVNHDRVFQINAGEGTRALEMASMAYQLSKVHAPNLQPQFRSRFDVYSYLYNTDGLVLSDTGFPVILLNEHINALENISRSHYHDITDTSDKIDWPYALSIVKTAIDTVASLALRH